MNGYQMALVDLELNSSGRDGFGHCVSVSRMSVFNHMSLKQDST